MSRCPIIICVVGSWLNYCRITLIHQVEWSKNDGDFIHKGLQFGKVYGKIIIRKTELQKANGIKYIVSL